MASAAIKRDRAVPRARVLMTGTLMTPDGAVAVRIRDISVVGAQIWAPSPVPGNCDAILKRGAFFAAARVLRSSERTVGLQFYRELTDAEFTAAFHNKAPTAAARPERPQRIEHPCPQWVES